MPVRLISSVRGIGVAVSVSTSTLARSCLIFSLCCTPKRCSSSITSSPRSLNFTSSESSRCVPITTSTSPAATSGDDRVCSFGGEEAREHLDPHRVAGEALAERLAVLVREQRRRGEDRDLLAVLHRLERRRASRPRSCRNPTSPQMSRSIGTGRSMSAFTSSIALQLVGRLLVRERVLELALPRRVRRRTRGRASRAAGGRGSRARPRSPRPRLRTLLRVFCHSAPPIR